MRWWARDRDPWGRGKGRVRVSTPVGEGLRWRGRGESGSRGESWAAAERLPRVRQGGAHPLFLPRGGEEQQGEEGGGREGGGHPLFVPG